MMQEKEKKYFVEPLFAHFNEYYVLKPYGYHHLFNVIADQHLKETNHGVGVLLAEKYAWVLVSLTFEIIEPILNLNELTGKTWYAGRRGPFFRREYKIEDEQGKTIARGASYTILMDLSNRSIFRGKEMPFKIFKERKEYVIDAEPRFKKDYPYEEITRRKVLNSHVDPIGHVNNLKYHEYIYDVLTDEEVKKIDKIKKVELYFQKELKKDDEFSISKFVDGNISYYRINNETLNMKAFTLVLHYSKD